MVWFRAWAATLSVNLCLAPLSFADDHYHHHHHRHRTRDLFNVFAADTKTVASNDKGDHDGTPKGPLLTLDDLQLDPKILSNLISQAHYGTNDDEHDHDVQKQCGTDHDANLHQEQMNALRMKAFQYYSSSSSDSDDDGQRRRRKLFPTSCEELCDQCIDIDLRLTMVAIELTSGYLIPHPTYALEFLVYGFEVTAADFSQPSDIATLFRDNVGVLNNAYQGTPFRFNWDGSYQIAINTNATFDGFGHLEELGGTYGSPELNVLDVFLVFQPLPSEGGGVTLGIATPGSVQTIGDGAYVRYDVLTGGGYVSSDGGYTLVHEIGHMLGLMHTFQVRFVLMIMCALFRSRLSTSNMCNTLLISFVLWPILLMQTFTALPSEYSCSPDEIPYGDFVDDTPLQRGPSASLDCAQYIYYDTLPDTCPNLPGRDALFNYMNYIDCKFGHKLCIVFCNLLTKTRH